MYDLAKFSLDDMLHCSAILRRLGEGAASMAEAAGRIVRFCYQHFGDGRASPRGCTLVRFYITHPYRSLDDCRQRFAARILAVEPPPDMICLTLLGTVGDEAAWNGPEQSAGHLALPLPSAEVIARMPMISRMLMQFGLDAGSVVSARLPAPTERVAGAFDVFYVPHALGSPYVPAQADFVERYGVRSVVGFGGMLPRGDVFAVVLFSKVAIAEATAEMFRPLALATKLAVLPFSLGPVFRGSDGSDRKETIHDDAR